MARRDKHFPESKAHPRIHKHLTQNMPRLQNTSHVMPTGRGFVLQIESSFKNC